MVQRFLVQHMREESTKEGFLKKEKYFSQNRSQTKNSDSRKTKISVFLKQITLDQCKYSYPHVIPEVLNTPFVYWQLAAYMQGLINYIQGRRRWTDRKLPSKPPKSGDDRQRVVQSVRCLRDFMIKGSRESRGCDDDTPHPSCVFAIYHEGA